MSSVQALVDHPDEVRRVINFKRLVLTDFKVDIPRLAKKKVLKAALDESGKRLAAAGLQLVIGIQAVVICGVGPLS